MTDEKTTTLHIRPSPDVLALLDAAEKRVGGALTRNRLVGLALARGLRDVIENPAVLFEVGPSAPTAAPPAEPQEKPRAAKTKAPPRAKTTPRKPTAGRWPPVAQADLRRLARDLAALDPETLKRAGVEADVGRSALYAAKNGKAGAQVFAALRAYLDGRAKP